MQTARGSIARGLFLGKNKTAAGRVRLRRGALARTALNAYRAGCKTKRVRSLTQQAVRRKTVGVLHAAVGGEWFSRAS